MNILDQMRTKRGKSFIIRSTPTRGVTLTVSQWSIQLVMNDDVSGEYLRLLVPFDNHELVQDREIDGKRIGLAVNRGKTLLAIIGNPCGVWLESVDIRICIGKHEVNRIWRPLAYYNYKNQATDSEGNLL